MGRGSHDARRETTRAGTPVLPWLVAAVIALTLPVAVVATSLVLVVPCLIALAAAWSAGRIRAATPP